MMVRNNSHTAKALAMYTPTFYHTRHVLMKLFWPYTTLCFPITLPFLPDLWLIERKFYVILAGRRVLNADNANREVSVPVVVLLCQLHLSSLCCKPTAPRRFFLLQ